MINSISTGESFITLAVRCHAIQSYCVHEHIQRAITIWRHISFWPGRPKDMWSTNQVFSNFVLLQTSNFERLLFIQFFIFACLFSGFYRSNMINKWQNYTCNAHHHILTTISICYSNTNDLLRSSKMNVKHSQKYNQTASNHQPASQQEEEEEKKYQINNTCHVKAFLHKCYVRTTRKCLSVDYYNEWPECVRHLKFQFINQIDFERLRHG